MVAEIAALWAGDEWHAVWFERECREKLLKGLRGIGTECTNLAREIELFTLTIWQALGFPVQILPDSNDTFVPVLSRGCLALEGTLIPPPGEDPVPALSVKKETSRSSSSSPKSANLPITEGSKRFPVRAAWLKTEMVKRGHLTRYRLHQNGGPDSKSIKRVLDGLPVSTNTLDRLTVGLSFGHNPAVSQEDIPSF